MTRRGCGCCGSDPDWCCPSLGSAFRHIGGYTGRNSIENLVLVTTEDTYTPIDDTDFHGSPSQGFGGVCSWSGTLEADSDGSTLTFGVAWYHNAPSDPPAGDAHWYTEITPSWICGEKYTNQVSGTIVITDTSCASAGPPGAEELVSLTMDLDMANCEPIVSEGMMMAAAANQLSTTLPDVFAGGCSGCSDVLRLLNSMSPERALKNLDKLTKQLHRATQRNDKPPHIRAMTKEQCREAILNAINDNLN